MDDETIDQLFGRLLARLKAYKPNDRSEKGRYCAILITDLEKLWAFFKVYVL